LKPRLLLSLLVLLLKLRLPTSLLELLLKLRLPTSSTLLLLLKLRLPASLLLLPKPRPLPLPRPLVRPAAPGPPAGTPPALTRPPLSRRPTGAACADLAMGLGPPPEVLLAASVVRGLPPVRYPPYLVVMLLSSPVLLLRPLPELLLLRPLEGLAMSLTPLLSPSVTCSATVAILGDSRGPGPSLSTGSRVSVLLYEHPALHANRRARLSKLLDREQLASAIAGARGPEVLACAPNLHQNKALCPKC
jgi:hypothetical protein